MYTIFDVETTGLDYKTHKIIEISGVKLDRYMNPVGEFSETVYQPVVLEKKIVELTGITSEELLIKGKKESEVMERFKEFIGNTILVAHNASFDLSFLYYSEFGSDRIYDFYDTLLMSRVCCKWLKEKGREHGLAFLSKEFGIDLSNHHRSIYDTRATAELFKYLFRMMRMRGLDLKNMLQEGKVNNSKGGFEFPASEFAPPRVFIY